MKTRSDFCYRIDRWDADGNSIVEHVAGIEDFGEDFGEDAPCRPLESNRFQRSAFYSDGQRLWRSGKDSNLDTQPSSNPCQSNSRRS
jgi:hypothetical protein